MSTLRYKPDCVVEELEIGECTMRRTGNASGASWWMLWFRVNRETDGQPDAFGVPMNPNGPWIADGPGGKTWSLARTTPGTWQVSPSINVLNTREVHPGEHALPSLWHQTPAIVGVPEDAPWIAGAP